MPEINIADFRLNDLTAPVDFTPLASGVPSDTATVSMLAGPGNMEFDRVSGLYLPSSTALFRIRAAIARARAGGRPAHWLVRGDSTTLGVLGGTTQILNTMSGTVSSTTVSQVTDFTGVANGVIVSGSGTGSIADGTTVSSFSPSAGTITLNTAAAVNGAVTLVIRKAANPTLDHAFPWVDQARTQAVARNILGGRISESIMSVDTLDSRFTFGTGWSGNSPLNVASTATGTLTFADNSADKADAFDITFLNQAGFGGGTIAAHVDSDTDTTFTAPSANNTVWTRRVSLVAGHDGSNHTLTLKAPSAGSVYIIAIEPVNTTTPALLRIGWVGISGQSLATVAPSNVGNGSSMAFMLARKSDMAQLHMGINDMHQWTTGNGTPAQGAAVYRANLDAWTQAWRARGAAVITNVWPSDGYASQNPGDWEALGWHQQIYDSALANNAAILDIQRRWGYGPEAITGINQMYDLVHPQTGGYTDMGTALADVLASL